MTEPNKKQYISNPFSVMAKGINALFKYNQNLAIIILCSSAFISVLNFFGNLPGMFASDSGGTTTTTTTTSAENPWAVGSLVVIILIIALIVIAVTVILSTLYSGIVAYTIVKTSKHETATFKESLRAAADKFWTVLWINIVVFFKVLGGALLFVIPGIRASLRYTMVMLPVFEENASAKEAIKKTKYLAKDHLMEIFGVVSLSGFVPLVGSLLSFGGQSIMYPQLKHLKASDEPKPPVHWLNYLSIFIMLGIVVLFVGLIGLIIVVSEASR